MHPRWWCTDIPCGKLFTGMLGGAAAREAGGAAHVQAEPQPEPPERKVHLHEAQRQACRHAAHDRACATAQGVQGFRVWGRPSDTFMHHSAASADCLASALPPLLCRWTMLVAAAYARGVGISLQSMSLNPHGRCDIRQ